MTIAALLALVIPAWLHRPARDPAGPAGRERLGIAQPGTDHEPTRQDGIATGDDW